ncbi:unnamed protein product [Clavelina lepadiformis]|uniref:ethanolamine kinase n=1 Tax=Clavelina lepadiformis TaxID=159417 RepID=A0ABP0F016_CLALP
MQSYIKSEVFVDLENALDGAKGILKLVRPNWEESDIKTQVFSNGITNKMFGFHYKNNKGEIILVRVNGNGTEIFLDREEEVKSFSLLRQYGCAPSLYCVFNNGLCYEFIKGITLTCQTVRLPSVYKLLAGELARVHSIPTKGDPPPKPTAFPLMRKFLAIAFASDSIIDGGLTVARKNEEQVLRKEVDELESCLTNLNSPIVFCHNDILLHNVIYNEHAEKISFIDYEYAGFNYQAYDIGNHFCEFAGIDDVDYNLYPGKDFQLKWLRHYLNAWYQYNFPDGCTDTSQMDDKVDILYKQVNKFALASHLSWGIWALVQAKYSTIDFDYKEYSKLRLDEYHRRKDDFLAL